MLGKLFDLLYIIPHFHFNCKLFPDHQIDLDEISTDDLLIFLAGFPVWRFQALAEYLYFHKYNMNRCGREITKLKLDVVCTNNFTNNST